LTYKPPTVIKGRIYSIKVREYTSGREYTVSNGGSVTVSEERVRITATLLNAGNTRGTIYAELIVDGVSKGTKSVTLDPSTYAIVPGNVYWDIELTKGSHTVTVKVGH